MAERWPKDDSRHGTLRLFCGRAAVSCMQCARRPDGVLGCLCRDLWHGFAHLLTGLDPLRLTLQTHSSLPAEHAIARFCPISARGQAEWQLAGRRTLEPAMPCTGLASVAQDARPKACWCLSRLKICCVRGRARTSSISQRAQAAADTPRLAARAFACRSFRRPGLVTDKESKETASTENAAYGVRELDELVCGHGLPFERRRRLSTNPSGIGICSEPGQLIMIGLAELTNATSFVAASGSRAWEGGAAIPAHAMQVL
ncbi:hypothetical protein K458DRAFT_455363 [Lentithecium fluviatile CBS 122367]|uniref:Uncharacterized protein n=1 Tax=Lentithecium fluviatile CBS 122367 TaxID=1168545 RepID=A0A6G1JLQ4_9PLEO|nr:hypothetical protein K458DRAFT_455363 [Lentithecium fluviatile CBS 122367]